MHNWLKIDVVCFVCAPERSFGCYTTSIPFGQIVSLSSQSSSKAFRILTKDVPRLSSGAQTKNDRSRFDFVRRRGISRLTDAVQMSYRTSLRSCDKLHLFESSTQVTKVTCSVTHFKNTPKGVLKMCAGEDSNL